MQLHFYRPLLQLARSLDIVDARFPLDRYRIVVAPALSLITAPLARHLEQHVRQGGHLILGPLSALAADADNGVRPSLAGAGREPLQTLLRSRREGCHDLHERVPVQSASGSGSAGIWGEDLSLVAARTTVLMRYGADASPLAGRPAAVLLRYGRGTITYLGAVLDPPLMSAFLQRSLSASGALSRFAPLPPDVQGLARMGDRRQLLILVNHGATARSMLLPCRMRDVLGRSREVRQVSLPARGVLVLEAGGVM
jgi:beta-galactosidase